MAYNKKSRVDASIVYRITMGTLEWNSFAAAAIHLPSSPLAGRRGKGGGGVVEFHNRAEQKESFAFDVSVLCAFNLGCEFKTSFFAYRKE